MTPYAICYKNLGANGKDIFCDFYFVEFNGGLFKSHKGVK